MLWSSISTLHHMLKKFRGSSEIREPWTNDENIENDAVQTIHGQRYALRNQAMILWRPTIRQLIILDRPNDLRGSAVEDDLRCENRKTIQNACLVCRLFNDLTSPLLCPVLWVNLGQTSLYRRLQLSHTSRVASRVRATRLLSIYFG